VNIFDSPNTSRRSSVALRWTSACQIHAATAEAIRHGVGKNKQAVVMVEQVPILVSDGNRLVPARARQLVLTNGLPLDEAEQGAWAPLNKAPAVEFGQTGLTYAPPSHQDVRKMSGETRRDSVPVRCELLGGPYWCASDARTGQASAPGSSSPSRPQLLGTPSACERNVSA
jgi:hypothetical protein